MIDTEWESYLQQPTRPRPADGYSPHTEGDDMKLEDVKEGLKRLIPIAELIAARTPNHYDDAVVALLKVLLSDDEKLATLVAAK